MTPPWTTHPRRTQVTSSLRCELLHEHSGVRVTVVQMPAVNTPQFSWVRSRLPRQPQPVPPIYQPEIAARGVVFAADHPRRKEYWVGAATAATIAANKVVPALLDRYLARTGYDSQQTGQKIAGGRPFFFGRPSTGRAGATMAHTASLTTGRTPGACSCGWTSGRGWCTAWLPVPQPLAASWQDGGPGAGESRNSRSAGAPPDSSRGLRRGLAVRAGAGDRHVRTSSG